MSVVTRTVHRMGGMPWNPMHELRQVGGHEYLMLDRAQHVAIIKRVEVRRPTGLLWRAVTADQDPAKRVLIGYFPTVQMAAAVTWRTWTQRGKPVEQHVQL